MRMYYTSSDGLKCYASRGHSVTLREPVKIHASVGLRGSNRPEDVKKVQRALNQVPVFQGGPITALAEDGLIGPKTTQSIQSFQSHQFPLWKPDSRIDPHQKTIARLNQIICSSQQTFNTSFAPTKNVNNDMTPDWPTVKSYGVTSGTLARPMIVDAISRLQQIKSSYGTTGPIANSAARREADWHFKFDQTTEPQKSIEYVVGTYERMLQALTRLQNSSYPLFLPGTMSPKDAKAYAPLGGIFTGPTQTDLNGELTNYIYLTSAFTLSPNVIIHELAHFCGGVTELSVGGNSPLDPNLHLSSPDPPPDGVPGDASELHHNYRNMTWFEARANVYSYQSYSYPDFRAKYSPPP